MSSGKTTISFLLLIVDLCTINLKSQKMIAPNKSIFNLIEIFRQGRKKVMHSIPSKKHCEEKGLHDFYCDAERPFFQK